jgi:glycine oxidase
MSKDSLKIAIIGAGIIGLACAWELLKRGAHVTLLDRHWPPMGASWAAAGMLGPAYEAVSEDTAHPHFFELCQRSANMWRAFAADLEQASSMSIGYCPGATLAIAIDEAQTERLRHLEDRLADLRVTSERLYREDVAGLERSVTPDVHKALKLEADGWVDPRQTVLALRAAFDAAGGVFEHVPGGVRVSDIEEKFDACLVSTGAATGRTVDAVQGVMLAFRRADLPLDHVVRCGAEYAVPRGDRVLLGATVGDVPDARSFLLSQAVHFLPRIRSAALLDQWTGWRPATADRAPIMGQMQGDGAYIANGHYRNGILLAPITAQIMADMMIDGTVTDLAAGFAPARLGATA